MFNWSNFGIAKATMGSIMRNVCTVFTVIGVALLGVDESQGQIVTSYYVAPTAVVAPAPVVATAVVRPVAPVVGAIPVRRGLFGLRTEYVPVLGQAAVVAPAVVAAPIAAYPTVTANYLSARPVISAVPYAANYAAPYTANYAAPYAANYAAPYAANFAAPYTANYAVPYSANYATPYTANYGAIPTASTYLPNAVVQSGYRGTSTVISGYAPAPLQYAPVIPAAPVAIPVTTFYPGAVMTMQ
jgi:hypothetical protein